jgi:elongation factor Ts
MEITSAQVKALRDETGAGMMDSKRALQEADGDFERAKEILRETGKAGITKLARRTASEGVVEAYLHRPDPNLPPKLGVLVELDCETDFVAMTDEFRRLARDIAMHVAAADPTYVSRDDIPSEVLERERKIYATQAEGKPDHIVERIVEGKLKDFYKQVVLLDQPFIRDQDRTIQELVDAYSERVRERLVLRRFSRYKVGEEA